MANLESIEGMGESFANKLRSLNIGTVEEFLDLGKTAVGRTTLAMKTGIGDSHIMNWVSRADLSRIKGMDGEYADLMECCGINTAPHLALRNAERLHNKMVEVNEAKKLVSKTPTLDQVRDWVAQSRKLPPIISY